MTRKTQNTATTHDPVTVHVRCNDEIHRLTWRDHRLVLEDHSENAVKMMDLLDTSCGCMEILRVIRSIPANPICLYECPKGFPQQLWESVQFSIDTLILHYTFPLLARFAEERWNWKAKIHIPRATLRLSTEPPLSAVWIPGLFQAKGQPLAIYRNRQWKVDRGVAHACTSLVPPGGSDDPIANQSLWAEVDHNSGIFFWKGCNLCGYQDPNASPMDKAPSPGLLRHAQKEKHCNRVLRAIAWVFEVYKRDVI